MMKCVIIGSGNVAEALADAVVGSSNSLVAIYARNVERGTDLADRYDCRHAEFGAELPDADIYLIAVTDGAVPQIASMLSFPSEAIVAHTAGGVNINALENVNHRAVFYPLQTFTKGRRINFRQVPLFLEYGDDHTKERLRIFAESLSENVYEADSRLRGRMHVAAVFACNFVNRMYGIAQELLAEDDLPFDVVKPLIAETCAKALTTDNPAVMQTGPAARGDKETQHKHLELIKDNKTKTEIYKLISNEIWETSKKI